MAPNEYLTPNRVQSQLSGTSCSPAHNVSAGSLSLPDSPQAEVPRLVGRIRDSQRETDQLMQELYSRLVPVRNEESIPGINDDAKADAPPGSPLGMALGEIVNESKRFNAGLYVLIRSLSI